MDNLFKDIMDILDDYSEVSTTETIDDVTPEEKVSNPAYEELLDDVHRLQKKLESYMCLHVDDNVCLEVEKEVMRISDFLKFIVKKHREG